MTILQLVLFTRSITMLRLGVVPGDCCIRSVLCKSCLFRCYASWQPSAGQLQVVTDVRCPAGALGVRTVHQVDAKAQLLVRALPKQANSLAAAQQKCAASDDEGSGDEAGWLDAAASRQLSGRMRHEAAQAERVAEQLRAATELQGLTGDSDVLPAPRFTSGRTR